MSQDNEDRIEGTCRIEGCKNKATKHLYLYTDMDIRFAVCNGCYDDFHPSWKREMVA